MCAFLPDNKTSKCITANKEGLKTDFQLESNKKNRLAILTTEFDVLSYDKIYKAPANGFGVLQSFNYLCCFSQYCY
ncbi:hypothetical protein C7N43_12510 [Sphingobacteriales bacterium UPWRP_1]|nr:hypothetical protein B6N25_03895 [Sphingobacteriales bacterium TSM_CSS]PSJ76667.1 hypothetical protein C7N43_12510 [Sphingobacteriales bacterium UPWRP_1]